MTVEVGRGTRIFNAFVGALARRGISVAGARELITTGRTSGLPRATPVNIMSVNGSDHLVAPRGHTQWVRNVRVNPNIIVRLGKREQSYVVTEIYDAEAVPVLRYYLKRWAWEVSAFFPAGISAKSSDAALLEVLPEHPVFRLTAA